MQTMTTVVIPARRFPAIILTLLISILGLFAPRVRAATIVHFTTTAGAFDVQLFDTTAPLTVANFLSYVTSGAYANTLFHRSAVNADTTPFVVQAGGFNLSGNQIGVIPAHAPVVNEYGAPNTPGTIAMAKSAGDPNSATDQFFFNVSDNSATLGPANNGGFTTFGQVIGNGMSVINALAAYPRYDASSLFGASFTEMPLNGYNSQVGLLASNLVLVNSITVIPEPGTLFLAVPATAAVLARRRRR